MSLQDDIFDVEDALKDKPEGANFERIMKVFYELENENDNLNKVFAALKQGARAVKYLIEGEQE